MASFLVIPARLGVNVRQVQQFYARRPAYGAVSHSREPRIASLTRRGRGARRCPVGFAGAKYTDGCRGPGRQQAYCSVSCQHFPDAAHFLSRRGPWSGPAWPRGCLRFVPFVQHVRKNRRLAAGNHVIFVALEGPLAQSACATEGGIPRSPRSGFGSHQGVRTETGWFSGDQGTFDGTLPTQNWRSR